MEDSIANPWLEDFRGFARTEIGIDVYFDQSDASSLPPSQLEFTNSSEACETFAYFDPYVQPRMAADGALSQVLERLLPCRKEEEEPLHQLPGWTQQQGDWQVSAKAEPWPMEVPYLSPVAPLFHPGHGYPSFDVRGPSHAADQLIVANRKATARKNRILLRQKSAPHQRPSSHSVQNSHRSGSPRPLKKFSNKVPQELLINTHIQGRNMDPLRFVLHKVLQPSDVNNLGRIVISKKEAEAHLPYLPLKEGIFITMEDFDTSDLWTFRYRFWPNIKSRMYLLESTGDFIRAHHLKKGDIVVLWRNNLRGTFVIQAMMALPNGGCASSTPSADCRGGNDVREQAREEDAKGKTKARRE